MAAGAGFHMRRSYAKAAAIRRRRRSHRKPSLTWLPFASPQTSLEFPIHSDLLRPGAGAEECVSEEVPPPRPP